MDQKDHIIAKRKHRVRLMGCGLSPSEIVKATDTEVEQCYIEVIQADEGLLPTCFFFNLLKRVFLKQKRRTRLARLWKGLVEIRRSDTDWPALCRSGGAAGPARHPG